MCVLVCKRMIKILKQRYKIVLLNMFNNAFSRLYKLNEILDSVTVILYEGLRLNENRILRLESFIQFSDPTPPPKKK